MLRNGLDRRLRTDRHEHGSLHRGVRQSHRSTTFRPGCYL
jgi:hypothetical protein